MTYYKDLSICTYFDDYFKIKNLKAVGWLSKGHPYSKGEVPVRIFLKIQALLEDAWQPSGGFEGWHECELCEEPQNESIKNLFIPGENLIYVSPEGILHYIELHSYKPPEEYMSAVKNCPRMNSPEYFESLKEIGGLKIQKVFEETREFLDR